MDGRVVQFSGGEPTIHPQFFEILSMAREMGFTHIQAATNGIELANLEFAKKAKAAGLATLYLQFDGVTEDIYRRVRGQSLLDIKMKVIENCRATGMKIVFVPTIVKGLNDHQIGDIVRVAIENVDTVSGISFQPVAFTGRIAKHELLAKRFTLSDLARCVSEQTGITDPRVRLVSAGLRHAVLEADGGAARHRRADHLVASALLAGHVFLCRREVEEGGADHAASSMCRTCCRTWKSCRARRARRASSSTAR